MDLIDVGLILKSVKTGLLGIIFIILFLQMIMKKYRVVIDTKLLSVVFIGLGFLLNLLEVRVIPEVGMLVFPTDNLGANMSRFIILVLLIALWLMLFMRMISFNQKRVKFGGHVYFSRYTWSTSKLTLSQARLPSDRQKRVALPKKPTPIVDVRFLIILCVSLLVLLIVRLGIRSLQSFSNIIWIIFECVELILWGLMGISLLNLKERIQTTIS